MSGSHPARARAQAPGSARARFLLPQRLVRQQRVAERVQQRKVGAEVPGEGRGPTHDVAADGSVIHRGENAPGKLAHATIYHEGRNRKSSNQALEGPAPAPVHGLAAKHYQVRIKGRGRLGQAIDRRADPHLYR